MFGRYGVLIWVALPVSITDFPLVLSTYEYISGEQARLTAPSILWLDSHLWARPSSLSRLHDQDTPCLVGLLWTSDQPDAETSAGQHNTHDGRVYILPVGFEPSIAASVRPQTHALGRTATGIAQRLLYKVLSSHQ